MNYTKEQRTALVTLIQLSEACYYSWPRAEYPGVFCGNVRLSMEMDDRHVWLDGSTVFASLHRSWKEAALEWLEGTSKT